MKMDCSKYIATTALLFTARQPYCTKNNAANPIITHTLNDEYPHYTTITHQALMSALNRFVITFCDNSAHVTVRTGMNSTARRLGIPISIVECRHEGVHEGVPGVGRLLDETSHALKWLWQKFWSRLGTPDTPSGRLQRNVAKILTSYRSARRHEFRFGNSTTEPRAHRPAVAALTKLQRKTSVGSLKQAISRTLVQQEKMLVPAGLLGNDLDRAVFDFWSPLLACLASVLRGFSALLIKEAQKACLSMSEEWVLVGVAGVHVGDGDGDPMDVDEEADGVVRTLDPRTEVLGTWILWLCEEWSFWETWEKQLEFWSEERWEVAGTLAMSDNSWDDWKACDRE